VIGRSRGTKYASVADVRAKSLEDLEIFQSALDAADAVSAILDRPCFRRDPELSDQLGETSSRIPPHIGEGFGQKTDRHFAHFLYIARGSCNEMRSHLTIAKGRNCITDAEWKELCGRYVVIGKRITRLAQHLNRENRVQRG
jgi:four helix bundle protein